MKAIEAPLKRDAVSGSMSRNLRVFRGAYVSLFSSEKMNRASRNGCMPPGRAAPSTSWTPRRKTATRFGTASRSMTRGKVVLVPSLSSRLLTRPPTHGRRLADSRVASQDEICGT